jgi:hypothetical protein
MDARIANFELLWARVWLPPIPPPAPLVRQTNAFSVLSPEDQARWMTAATHEERLIIEQEDRVKRGLDRENLFGDLGAEQGAEQGAVPYYECDDDDDMRWIE